MKDLTKETFSETILSKDVALVDFWASWCEPCKAMSPVLDRIDADHYPVYKVDVDDQMELAKSMGIQSMPTLVLFRHGEEVKRVVGARSLNGLLEELKD